MINTIYRVVQAGASECWASPRRAAGFIPIVSGTIFAPAILRQNLLPE